MKNLTILSVVVASMLLVGCGEEKKEATAPVAEKATTEATKAPEAEKTTVEKAKEVVAQTASKVADKTAEVVEEAKKVATEAVEATKKATAEAVAETKEVVKEKVADAKEAVSSAVDTKACAACHGVNFEKKAMNVSKIVKDLSKEDIIKALKGYKDGSYGGAMKGLMKGQVASYDDAKIEAVAGQIAK